MSMNEINNVRLPFVPAGGINELNKKSVPTQVKEGKNDFNKIFQDELNNLKFSAHAKARISSREIDLAGNDMERLTNAIDRAKQKGAKESLIIMDEKAFIVNIKNSTVITAVSKNQLESNVITNIDSAVIA